MTKKLLILFLMTLTLMVGCKKIKPPVDESQANEPIYKLEGIMNGDSLNLYVDDSTVFIDNSPYNINGIEAYASTISDAQNKFELTAVVIRPEIFLDQEGVKLIENKDVDYFIQQEVCFEADFGTTNQANNFKINIDGESYLGPNFYVPEYGVYDAVLNFPNINSLSYHLPIKAGFNNEILNPYFEMYSSNNNINFLGDNAPTLSHKWYINDDIVSNNALDTISIWNYPTGIHYIKHEVTDNYGNVAEHQTLFYLSGGDIYWMLKLDNSCSNSNVVKNNYGRGFIEATYNGETYTSVFNLANQANKLKIYNIEYFINPNTQSIEFIKFNLDFDAELKNAELNKTLNLENMHGVFSIKIE
jgi:hypothetical protein